VQSAHRLERFAVRLAIEVLGSRFRAPWAGRVVQQQAAEEALLRVRGYAAGVRLIRRALRSAPSPWRRGEQRPARAPHAQHPARAADRTSALRIGPPGPVPQLGSTAAADEAVTLVGAEGDAHLGNWRRERSSRAEGPPSRSEPSLWPPADPALRGRRRRAPRSMIGPRGDARLRAASVVIGSLPARSGSRLEHPARGNTRACGGGLTALPAHHRARALASGDQPRRRERSASGHQVERGLCCGRWLHART